MTTSDTEAAQRELATYTAPDMLVVRGLASAKVEPMCELARQAAPPA